MIFNSKSIRSALLVSMALTLPAVSSQILAQAGTTTTTAKPSTREREKLAIKLVIKFLFDKDGVAMKPFADDFNCLVGDVPKYKAAAEKLKEVAYSGETRAAVIGLELSKFLDILPPQLKEELKKRGAWNKAFALAAIERSLLVTAQKGL